MASPVLIARQAIANLKQRWPDFVATVPSLLWSGRCPDWTALESTPSRVAIWTRQLFLLFAVGVAANALNVANTGYLTEDDVRFGAASQQLEEHISAPIFSFRYLGHFHYRPLTWWATMHLAHHVFPQPELYHFIMVSAAVLNATLVYALARLMGFSSRLSFVVYLAFLLNPATSNNAGHVSAIGDHISLFFTLALCVLLAIDYRRTVAGHAADRWSWLLHLAAATCLILGLTSKESMILVPPLLIAFAVCFVRWRGLYWAIVWSVGITLLYVAMRWAGMSSMGHGSGYQIVLSTLAERLTCYFSFPFVYDHLWVHNLYRCQPLSVVLTGAAIHAGILVMLGLRNRWAPLIYLAFWAISLLPVMPIAMANINYLYATGIPMAFAIAYLWQGSWKVSKAYSLVVLTLLALHSYSMQQYQFETGGVQQKFYATLRSILLSNGQAIAMSARPDLKVRGEFEGASDRFWDGFAASLIATRSDSKRIVVNVDKPVNFYRIRNLTHAVFDYDGLAVKETIVTLQQPEVPQEPERDVIYLQMLDGGELFVRHLPARAEDKTIGTSNGATVAREVTTR